MIYLKVRGRLGNQLFQYATANSIQKKYYQNEKLAIDFSDLKKLGKAENGFCDSLKHFNVEDYETVDKMKMNIVQRIIVFMMKIPNPLLRVLGFKNSADKLTYEFEKFIQPFINYFGIYYMIHGFVKFKKSKFKNKVIIGNFESSEFFDFNEQLIKEMYAPKNKEIEANKELYEIIKNNESVCVTIRRGDFIFKEEFKKVHYVCDENYFYKGIELIKKKVKNPVFIIFSDDVEWVKNNMNFPGKVYYETGNDPVWEKLRLMYHCKHFIISNSTFSWWAQYLSNNKKKVVVAPKIWKNITYKKDAGSIDIYQSNWIKI